LAESPKETAKPWDYLRIVESLSMMNQIIEGIQGGWNCNLSSR